MAIGQKLRLPAVKRIDVNVVGILCAASFISQHDNCIFFALAGDVCVLNRLQSEACSVDPVDEAYGFSLRITILRIAEPFQLGVAE